MTDVPHWFTTNYSGRSGCVPVPTLMTQQQQTATLDQMRQLVHDQARELFMVKARNNDLHVLLRRANKWRMAADAEQALLEEAGELVKELAKGHEWRHADGWVVSLCDEDSCKVCDLAKRLKAK